MSADDVIKIIGISGIVIVGLIVFAGLFANEIVMIIKALRGDDD
jgi:hypothetical protein